VACGESPLGYTVLAIIKNSDNAVACGESPIGYTAAELRRGVDPEHVSGKCLEEPHMETVLGTIISYLISLAAGLRTDAILARHEEKLREQLQQEDALRKALASTRSLREELRAACAELARNRQHLGVPSQEEPLWRLLSDDIFQADLAEWLMAGGIEEGDAVKERLLRRMETALAHTGASPEQVAFLRSGYFDAVEKAVFAHPILAHWRHQLSLDYLREQVAVLRRRAEEGAGVYSPEKQKSALDRYCEKALAAWDIIDLSNLPERSEEHTSELQSLS